MRKILFFVLILFSQITFALTQHDIDKRLQSSIDDFRQAQHISSATLTISYPNDQSPKSYMSGSVLQGGHDPVNKDHLFQVGSITKSFIAAIVLNLQSQGRLSLDDRLSYYFPEYTQWGDATIRQLLNHTSGIFNYTDSLQFRSFFLSHPYDYLEADTLIGFAANEPSYFKPGNGWHYSNTNYVLLGKLIERIDGRSIDRILEDYILQNPDLNLGNSFFIKHVYSDPIKTRMMHGYYQLSSDNEMDVTSFSMSWLNSAGGIISNGSDLTSWIRSLFAGKILNASNLNEFKKLVSTDNGQPISNVSDATPNGYGLGIQAWQTPWKNLDVIWWHSGGTVGYKSLMMWLPKQQIAIVLSYTQVIAGKEGIPFAPSTPLAQEVLGVISDQYGGLDNDF